MSDEGIRTREREGELDLAAILRPAPDRKRRLGLIRLCAKLGHEGAQRWQEELGLREITKPVHAWILLSEAEQRLWFAGAAERALRSVSLDVDPRAWGVLETARQFASGEIGEEELREASYPVVLSGTWSDHWSLGVVFYLSLPDFWVPMALQALREAAGPAPPLRKPHSREKVRAYLDWGERADRFVRDAELDLADYFWPEVIDQ